MNWKRIALALPALGLWACLDRNYENPFLSESTPDTTAPQPPAGQVDTAKPDADTVKPTEPPREDAEIFEEDVSVSPIILTVGDPPVGPDIVWKPSDATTRGYSLVSSHPSFVLVVSEGGMAKCKAVAPGVATLSLKTGGRGLVKTFKVTVMPQPLISIPVLAITAEDMEFDLGSARSPIVDYTPALATHKAYSLVSDDTSIVSVSGYTLQAVAGGKARITITSVDGPSSTFEATVRIPVASVSAPDLTLEKGATTTPLVKILPENADNRKYTLATSDPNTVFAKGTVITAVAAGTAAIIITSGDGKRSGAFTVKVVLSQKELALKAAAERLAEALKEAAERRK